MNQTPVWAFEASFMCYIEVLPFLRCWLLLFKKKDAGCCSYGVCWKKRKYVKLAVVDLRWWICNFVLSWIFLITLHEWQTRSRIFHLPRTLIMASNSWPKNCLMGLICGDRWWGTCIKKRMVVISVASLCHVSTYGNLDLIFSWFLVVRSGVVLIE